MSYPSADDENDALGTVLFGCILLTVLFVVAFVFKVWNERQQTEVYTRSAEAQERMADALERAYPKKQIVISTSTVVSWACKETSL